MPVMAIGLPEGREPSKRDQQRAHPRDPRVRHVENHVAVDMLFFYNLLPVSLRGECGPALGSLCSRSGNACPCVTACLL